MQKLIEKLETTMRNRARRKLAAEYGRNLLRNKRIIAQLGLLNSRAEIEATAARLADDWPASKSLSPQAEAVRRVDDAPAEPSHFAADLKHFRADFCGGPALVVMPRGVVEDDVGIDGLPGQWNKPVGAA